METSTAAITLSDKVKELEPIIRQHADEAEKIRRLPQPVVEAMIESGLFGIWKFTVAWKPIL